METKICSKCKDEKNIEDFGWRQKSKNIRQYQCILCMRITSKENYQRNKENIKRRVKENKQRHRREFQDWKDTLSCEKCDEDANCCLDFHHIDPNKKDFNVSKMIDWSLERAKAEAAKCKVLCSNCHRKVHAGLLPL